MVDVCISTLDHLSAGRVVLGVGLGDKVNKDLKAFCETGGWRMRVEMLNESLDIIAGLQSGLPFHYTGKHYCVLDALFMSTRLQSPRIPFWVPAHGPFKQSLKRAARWDGVLPCSWDLGPITPVVLQEIIGFIPRYCSPDTPFVVIKYGYTEGKKLVKEPAMVQEFAAAGANWWIGEIYSGGGNLGKM